MIIPDNDDLREFFDVTRAAEDFLDSLKLIAGNRRFVSFENNALLADLLDQSASAEVEAIRNYRSWLIGVLGTW